MKSGQQNEDESLDTLLSLEGEADILHLITTKANRLRKEGLEANVQELKLVDAQAKWMKNVDEIAVQNDGPDKDLLSGIKDEQALHNIPDDEKLQKIEGIWIKDARLWVPPNDELRRKLMVEWHDSPSAGHFGRDRTISSMKKVFYWKHMRADIEDHVVSCLACQRNKPRRNLTNGELCPIPLPGRPWGSITLDMITDLPKSKRQCDFADRKNGETPTYNAELVIVCRLTKEAEFAPVRKDMSARQFAHLFVHLVFSRHGMCDDITTDRARLFTSEFWSTFTAIIGTTRKISTAFHPQTDGLTERLNATLEQYWRGFVGFTQDEWADLSDMAAYCWNSSTSPTTNISPFEANGKMVIPFQLANLKSYKSESAKELAKRMKETLDKLQESLTHAQNVQARYYDNKHKRVEFAAKDLVMLNTKHLATNQQSKKLGPKFAGPFRVKERKGLQAYKLDLPNTWGCHDVFHVSLLSPFKGRARGALSTEILEPGPELVMDDVGNEEEEYEVERILKSSRRYRWRKLYYLVKWTGWSDDHNSWIRPEDMPDAQEAIREFHEQHPFMPGPEEETEKQK